MVSIKNNDGVRVIIWDGHLREFLKWLSSSLELQASKAGRMCALLTALLCERVFVSSTGQWALLPGEGHTHRGALQVTKWMKTWCREGTKWQNLLGSFIMIQLGKNKGGEHFPLVLHRWHTHHLCMAISLIRTKMKGFYP